MKNIIFILFIYVILSLSIYQLSKLNKLNKLSKLNYYKSNSINKNHRNNDDPNTKWYTSQTLDHFDSNNIQTFSQRYFINDTFFNGNGPIFLCVGGEGPELTPDVVITGNIHCAIMINLAIQNNGLILALEHRYYGQTYPTSDVSTENLKYLSSKQGLEDLSQFHGYITDLYNLTQANKWITFGGSYPGMMAGWFRLKYPNLVYASVASSAPVLAQLNFQGYNDVISYALSDPVVGGSDTCLANVKSAFSTLGQLYASEKGQLYMAESFNICPSQSLSNINDFATLVGNLAGLFGVQENDPLCQTVDCGLNLASWCSIMTNTSQSPIENLVSLNTILSSGQCSDVSYGDTIESITNTTLLGGTNRVWTYQTCTEFAFYQTCDPDSKCPFTTSPHVTDLNSFTSQCVIAFNISVDETIAKIKATNDYYGGNQPMGSRIMYVNGDIDPWHPLSVLSSLPGEPALVVEGSSHHYWTRPSNPKDSIFIQQSRKAIMDQVNEWLAE